MRALNIVLLFTAVFSGAAAFSASCSPDYPSAAFRCDPSQREEACPESKGEEFICCSDDGAAAPGPLPAHPELTTNIGGEWGSPLFSGIRNEVSRTGICFRKSQIDVGITTPSGTCPIPCNPLWKSDQITKVCGMSVSCCQTVEMTERDCVWDGACYRPANGGDITDTGLIGNDWGEGPDPWSRVFHDTNQDPGAKQCEQLANADPNFNLGQCYQKLSVADQRGFCYPDICPLTQDLGYLDACAEKNIAAGLTQCAQTNNVQTLPVNPDPMDDPMPTATGN